MTGKAELSKLDRADILKLALQCGWTSNRKQLSAEKAVSLTKTSDLIDFLLTAQEDGAYDINIGADGVPVVGDAVDEVVEAVEEDEAPEAEAGDEVEGLDGLGDPELVEETPAKAKRGRPPKTAVGKQLADSAVPGLSDEDMEKLGAALHGAIVEALAPLHATLGAHGKVLERLTNLGLWLYSISEGPEKREFFDDRFEDIMDGGEEAEAEQEAEESRPTKAAKGPVVAPPTPATQAALKAAGKPAMPSPALPGRFRK